MPSRFQLPSGSSSAVSAATLGSANRYVSMLFVDDGALLPARRVVRRVHPALPPLGVEGLELVRLGEDRVGRALVEDLLHLLDDGDAPRLVDRLALLAVQPGVLEAGPQAGVPALDLLRRSCSSPAR